MNMHFRSPKLHVATRKQTDRKYEMSEHIFQNLKSNIFQISIFCTYHEKFTLVEIDQNLGMRENLIIDWSISKCYKSRHLYWSYCAYTASNSPIVWENFRNRICVKSAQGGLHNIVRTQSKRLQLDL